MSSSASSTLFTGNLHCDCRKRILMPSSLWSTTITPLYPRKRNWYAEGSTQYSLRLRLALHFSSQIMWANSGEMVPTPSECGPMSGCSSHWSRRIFTLRSVVVNACAILAAYLLGVRRRLEKSPSEDRIFSAFTYPSTGSRNGETNQTECSRRELVEYARNSNARPPSSNPSRRMPPTRRWRKLCPSVSPYKRNARRSSSRNSTRMKRSARAGSWS